MMKILLPFLFLFSFYNAQVFNQPRDIYYCDANNDGSESINLTQVQSHITNDNAVVFKYYELPSGLEIINPINYILTGNSSIYILQQLSGPGNPFEATFQIVRVICSANEDNDGVPNSSEDLNHDNNFNNDDTDADKIANFRDNDDDGDGILTINEDYNGNGNPMDDDVNSNGIPDYLDNQATLSNSELIRSKIISVYPNPARDFVTVASSENILNLELYAISGNKIRSFSNKKVDISNLDKGIYILKIITDRGILHEKLIKD